MIKGFLYVPESEVDTLKEKLMCVYGEDNEAWKREKKRHDKQVKRNRRIVELFSCFAFFPILFLFYLDWTTTYTPWEAMDLFSRPPGCFAFICVGCMMVSWSNHASMIAKQIMFERIMKRE